MGRILIAEDEENIREVLLRALQALGHQVVSAADGDAAAELLSGREFDLVITDLRMPGRDGLALLDLVKENTHDTSVMLMTAYGSVENAVAAMKRGADDYLVKPFRLDELEVKVEKIFSERRLNEQNRLLVEQADAAFGRLVGASAAMQGVYRLIEQVALSDATVLITGETGTGKELVAHTLHNLSPQAQGPFITVHCAAYSQNLIESELFGHERGAFTGATAQRKGRLELADHGTLFLDELGEIPLEVQVKLLRFLESRTFERVGGNESLTVKVRVVAATHRDLPQMVGARTFREDLFWRLNVFPIALPPLRERGDDVLALARHFLEKKSQGRTLTLSRFAERLLREYPWPGNVRELQNIIERAVLLSPGDMLRVDAALARPAEETRLGEHNLPRILETVEKRLIREALAQCDGVQAQAAKLLGIQRSTLQYKLQKYDLDAPAGGRG
ncbi:MAG: sigma-54-dependent Fis family transcriptional regulator [Candidatus Firestonebacteria bacterium]|nr:sigma-54-dependent Fis family transcriptional regulator [Candidatus Firestonebacteria bacterium]